MRWNASNIVPNPCAPNCENRAVGCHGTCEKYHKYRKRLKEVRKREKRYRQFWVDE